MMQCRKIYQLSFLNLVKRKNILPGENRRSTTAAPIGLYMIICMVGLLMFPSVLYNSLSSVAILGSTL